MVGFGPASGQQCSWHDRGVYVMAMRRGGKKKDKKKGGRRG